MKTCRKCDIELVVGENWTASRAKNGEYICRDCVKAYKAEYYKANPEKKRAQNAEYYKANTEKVKARQAEYNKANPEKKKAYNAKWRKANPEKVKERNAKYYKANPGKINAKTAKRRALIKQQTPSWYCHATVTEIYEVAAEFGYEVDHIVPISKGGLHSHENLQLLTQRENASKGARETWIT